METILAIIAACILFSWWMSEREAAHDRAMEKKYGKRKWRRRKQWLGPR